MKKCQKIPRLIWRWRLLVRFVADPGIEQSAFGTKCLGGGGGVRPWCPVGPTPSPCAVHVLLRVARHRQELWPPRRKKCMTRCRPLCHGPQRFCKALRGAELPLCHCHLRSNGEIAVTTQKRHVVVFARAKPKQPTPPLRPDKLSLQDMAIVFRWAATLLLLEG